MGFLKKVGRAIKPALGVALPIVGGALGGAPGSMVGTTMGNLLQKKQDVRGARAAVVAANGGGMGGPMGIGMAAGYTLSGTSFPRFGPDIQDAGPAVQLQDGTVDPEKAGGITRDRQRAAIKVLHAVFQGGSDSGIRSLARDLRVTKKDALGTLMWMTFFPIQPGGAGVQLSGSDKILIANEIERIFKRRARGPISKSLRRLVKQVQFFRKMMGTARSIGGGGRRKGR